MDGPFYFSIPEYRAHPGCPHPVHDHTRDGCLAYGCRCLTPRQALAAPSGIRHTIGLILRGIGLIWVLVHVFDFVKGWLI